MQKYLNKKNWGFDKDPNFAITGAWVFKENIEGSKTVSVESNILTTFAEYFSMIWHLKDAFFNMPKVVRRVHVTKEGLAKFNSKNSKLNQSLAILFATIFSL